MCTRMTTKGTSNFNFQSITHDTRKVPWYLVPCTSCNPIECSRDHNHGRDVELMAQNRLRIIEGNCVVYQENEPNFTLVVEERLLLWTQQVAHRQSVISLYNYRGPCPVHPACTDNCFQYRIGTKAVELVVPLFVIIVLWKVDDTRRKSKHRNQIYYLVSACSTGYS